MQNFKKSEKNKKNEEKDGLKPFNEEFTNYNYQSMSKIILVNTHHKVCYVYLTWWTFKFNSIYLIIQLQCLHIIK